MEVVQNVMPWCPVRAGRCRLTGCEMRSEGFGVLENVLPEGWSMSSEDVRGRRGSGKRKAAVLPEGWSMSFEGV